MWGQVATGIGVGALGGLLSGGKSSTPDTRRQEDLVKKLKDSKQRALEGTFSKFPGQLQDYAEKMRTGFEDIRNRMGTGTNEYLQKIKDTTADTRTALRSALNTSAFGGVPAALRMVREAGGAGAGVGSGAYLRSLQGVGESLASKLAEGEQEIQAQGLKTETDAQSQAYNTFSNLEAKLGQNNLDLITKVMDTGKEDDLRRMALQMGIDEEEVQSLVDLMNFQESGKLAANSNKDILGSTLAGIGGQIAGSAFGKKA